MILTPMDTLSDIIKLFLAGNSLTKKRIMDDYDVSYRTAHRYIDRIKNDFLYCEEILDSGEISIKKAKQC